MAKRPIKTQNRLILIKRYILSAVHLKAFIHDTFAKIDEFYVAEAHQKQGYGSALMSDMVRRLTQVGITDVYLVTDLEDTAQALYRKMGYQFAGSFKQYQKIY